MTDFENIAFDLHHKIAMEGIDRLQREIAELKKDRDEWKQRALRYEEDLRKIREKMEGK